MNKAFGVSLTFLLILSFTGTVMAGEIHEAAGNGDLMKVKSLVKGNYACINSRDGAGMTPLGRAAAGNHINVIRFIISKNIDVNGTDGKGQTPLHYAAANGMKDAAAVLFSCGAMANIKDGDGQTPLHKAAAHGMNEMTEILLKNGARINDADSNGNSALELALENRHRDTASLLRRHGAKGAVLNQWFFLIGLIVLNIPFYLIIGVLIFKDWEGFGHSLHYVIKPDIVSWLDGTIWEDWWEELRFQIFAVICVFLVGSEYALLVSVFEIHLVG